MEHLEKAREYRARTYNFAGFALMAPLGHIFIDPVTLFKQMGLIGFVFYVIVCSILFFAGLCLIEIGRDILYSRR
jgi:hypothetical protein